jgi:hypothetical protein
VTPGAAAAAPVMATGIVAEALALDGHDGLSAVVLAVTIAIAVALLGVLAAALRADPRAVARGARTPPSLTVVAALGVVGTRLTQVGARAAGVALLALAVAVWAPLLVFILRAWRRPAPGGAFLVSVATQAIAVLCAALGARGPAVALLVAGLGLYVVALASFDLRDIARGRGDQWIAGGALAIAALAAAAAHVPRPAPLALWALAIAWLPVLVAGEAIPPRCRFDARRWSTVFPVGMYAAMSHAVGVTAFARWWTWVAVAVWALVAAGSVRALDRSRTCRWRPFGAADRMAP